MVHLDLFYTLLALFVVSAIINIFQYVTICGLQDRLDTSEDKLDKSYKNADALRRNLRAARVETEQQRSRAERAELLPKAQPLRTSDPLFRSIEKAREEIKAYPHAIGPVLAHLRDNPHPQVDHVHAAVMAGHTGLMAAAHQQYQVEQKKRVDEQRRLEKSKHVQATSTEVDSYSHIVATSNPSPPNWVNDWFRTEPAPMRQHYIGNNDCVPIDHSPSSHHSHTQDHASFSCDSGPSHSSSD